MTGEGDHAACGRGDVARLLERASAAALRRRRYRLAVLVVGVAVLLAGVALLAASAVLGMALLAGA